MKTFSKTLILVLILSVTMFGCGKKSDSISNSSTSASFTFGGTTFKATSSFFTNNEFITQGSSNSSATTITTQFVSRPAAGNYTVVNNLTYGGNLAANQCFINVLDANSNIYYSYKGGTVTVTVNNGKLTAKFSGIAMASSSSDNNGNLTFIDAGTASGTLTEGQ